MTGNYLNVLDGLLSAGASHLSQAFREVQIRFVLSNLQPDGGFRGRQGGSDLYYTDFALRVLSLCGYDLAQLSLTTDFVDRNLRSPRDIVECFNGLNCLRMLELVNQEADFEDIALKCLEAQRLVEGGFSRPGGNSVSAYNTFLGKLCLLMLGSGSGSADSPAASLRKLKRQNGGFAETLQESASQTSATAAVITTLLLDDELTISDTHEAACFFKTMQKAGGGLLPCAKAPDDDLLSTFTALSCLFLTNTLEHLDLSAIARLTKLSMATGGGFRGCPTDSSTDVEYTFYGLGILSILQLYRQGNRQE